MKKTVLMCFLLITMTVVFSAQAWPHSLDRVGISVRYENNKIQLIANVPVNEFMFLNARHALDVNDDGIISIEELIRRQNELIEDAKSKILFLNQTSDIPELSKVDVKYLAKDLSQLKQSLSTFTPTQSQPQTVEYIKLTFDYAWLNTPNLIDLRYSLLETIALTHIQILDQSQKNLTTADMSLDNNIIRIKSLDTSDLGATKSKKASLHVQTIWQTGVWHVLKGADHILFILALVLVVRSFNALLLPLTSFTLCHSITLALIAQGFTHSIPAWTIEVAIAASILLLLAYDILGKNIKSLSWITGGLGIIHGMGFAQALTDTLGDLMSWANALVKMTLAIELTQLGIACLGLAIIYLINKFIPKQLVRYYQVSSALIAIMASYWLLERIILVF